MSDAQRRAVRTLLQGVTGAAIVGFFELFVFPYLPNHPTLSTEQRAMAATILGTLVAFAQNWLEDHTNMPAMLKATASSGKNPMDVDPKL